MHVTTIDRFRPESGELLTWSVDSSDATPQRSRIPLSFNQGIHLAGAGEHSTWLAAAFRVEGPIDRHALGLAYHALIVRHGTLHSSFVKCGDTIVREEFDPLALRLAATPGVRVTSDVALQQVLWAALDAACHPFGFPAYLLGAIDRPDSSTILCGFDHSHVDAYSMSIIVDDVHRLYHGFRRSPELFAAEELPMIGSYVDYCAAEAETTEISSSDSRLLSWLHFFDQHDGHPPTFPLDLGVREGGTAPQGADVRPLLGPSETEEFADFCRRNGGSVYAGVLSAMAQAVNRLGGGPQLSLLFPMHTRRTEPWRNAVGWFTTNAPIRVDGTDDLCTGLQRTGPELRRAVRLGDVPIARVIAALGGFTPIRNDIFMVSYVDYRNLPGADLHDEIDAHHISNVTTADDAQFWISRTGRGLAVRSRFPDTAVGRATVGEFLEEVRTILRTAVPTARRVAVVTPLDGGDGPLRAPSAGASRR
ncbi:peptide synthase [Gordonia sp. HNM0687]|uniref:Peptide synthase n=1 Tax=Gordonia mangrovi TaxID=2665643 RepID=A0A6L7GUW1_9ACTN|nr:peptide synthase [Gordonia mangrovi]UVF77141.1 condensation domain-containing protein [Gordonia mangrovi]